VKVGSDVVVIDDNDGILAVGRAKISSNMMKELGAGVAVRIRQGIKSRRGTEGSI
jgi:archaeosine-15-forming tRNA-guanine transglycosylase